MLLTNPNVIIHPPLGQCSAQVDLTNPKPCIAQLTHEQVYDRDPTELAFVLKHGKHYQKRQLPRGISLGQKGHCYANAYFLALGNRQFTYVEGIARTHESKPFKNFGPNCYIPFPHAWCCDPNGYVVDPTWGDSGGIEYFGVAFRTRFVWDLVSDLGRWTLIRRECLHRIVDLPKDRWSHAIHGTKPC